jgi:transposase
VEKNTTIAVDLAKSVFEIAVSEHPGRIGQRRRLGRSQLLAFFAQQPPATVLLEACGSAHFWAREVALFGHRVVLLPPHRTRTYRAGSKSDRTDAKALLEAHRNEEIRPVPIKSVEQQTLGFLHRLRSGWLRTRTARLNTLRGILRELGETIPLGARHVVPRVRELLEEADSPVPEALRPFLAELVAEVRECERRIAELERQLQRLAREIPAVAYLLSTPGIGLVTATALVAFVGDIRRFRTGRCFGSYLGLVPKERSSGETRRLGRITKRGDAYLRMLLIHGARAVLAGAKRRPTRDPLAAWALDLQARRGHNKAAVALANKLARIAWSVWKENRNYEVRTLAAAA